MLVYTLDDIVGAVLLGLLILMCLGVALYRAIARKN